MKNGKPYYCTGFMAFRDTPNSRNLVKLWAVALGKNPQLNQPVFNQIVLKNTLKAKPLSRVSFPSGNFYFDQHKQAGVTIVHNNFIQGKDNKIARFRKVGLWNPKPFAGQELATPQVLAHAPARAPATAKSLAAEKMLLAEDT